MPGLQMRAFCRKIFLGQDANGHKLPHHESNLVWGPLGIGVSIVLTVIAAMKHDLRFLLCIACPCSVFGAWGLCKRIPYRNLSIWIWIATSIAVTGGLYALSQWLEPNGRIVASTAHLATPVHLGPTTNLGVSTSLETKIRRARWNSSHLSFRVTERQSSGLRIELWTDAPIKQKVRLIIKFIGDVDDVDVSLTRNNLQTIVEQHSVEISFDGEFKPIDRLLMTVHGKNNRSPESAAWWGVDANEP